MWSVWHTVLLQPWHASWLIVLLEERITLRSIIKYDTSGHLFRKAVQCCPSDLSEGSERHAGCLLFQTSLQRHTTLHLQTLPQSLKRADTAGRPVGEGLVESLRQLGPHSVAVHSCVGVLAEVLHGVHHTVDLLQQVELLLQGEVRHSICHGGQHLHLCTCGQVVSRDRGLKKCQERRQVRLLVIHLIHGVKLNSFRVSVCYLLSMCNSVSVMMRDKVTVFTVFITALWSVVRLGELQ